MFRRRSRSLDELLRDPHFPYHVGRLMGATEMTAHWLSTRGEEEQRMGARLAAIVDWFFEHDREHVRARPSEEITQVLPPATASAVTETGGGRRQP